MFLGFGKLSSPFFDSLIYVPQCFLNDVIIYSDSKDPEEIASLRVLERLGEKVLTIAVLVILITAPIGAVAVMTAG